MTVNIEQREEITSKEKENLQESIKRKEKESEKDKNKNKDKDKRKD
jgi:hypothetical protein